MSGRLSPTPDEARRHLDRLADRLRVMGPRLAGRDSPEALAHLAAVRAGLQRLADLAAARDGRQARAVPELGVHALADQALVLGHDLLGPDLLGPDLFGADLLGPDLLGADLLGADLDAFRAEAVAAIDSVYGVL